MKKIKFYRPVPKYTIINIKVFNKLEDQIEIISKKDSERVTLCSSFDTDTNEISFGAAICSKKDVFIKKKGSEVALKRATENPIFKIKVPTSSELKEFCSLQIKKIEAIIDIHGKEALKDYAKFNI